MSKLIETTPGGKLRATPAFEDAVRAEFASGTKLPDAIRKFDATTKAKTIHLVAPIYWRADAESRPFPAETRDDARKLRAAILAARKSGDRREIVAVRAGVSVARVAEIEAKKPVYTGRGTRKHLAVAAAPVAETV